MSDNTIWLDIENAAIAKEEADAKALREDAQKWRDMLARGAEVEDGGTNVFICAKLLSNYKAHSVTLQEELEALDEWFRELFHGLLGGAPNSPATPEVGAESFVRLTGIRERLRILLR